MPKILIKEFDKTSAGTPGSYANYSVLITGFKGTPSDKPDAKIVKPDSNGVYEFTSKQEFLDTIGKTNISHEVIDGDGATLEYHYGNLMAQELLDIGYPIIYKVIDKVSDMDSKTFWEVFKDKASYDFRFISHGLLETCADEDGVYTALMNRLTEIETDVEELAAITEEVDEEVDKDASIADADKAAAKAAGYVTAYRNAVDVEKYNGFKNDAGNTYADYATACGYLAEGADGKIKAVEDQQKLINDHAANHVNGDVFNNINGHIAKLASYTVKDDGTGDPINEGRGDCIALIELNEKSYIATSNPVASIIEGINAMPESVSNNGAYCALTVPSVYYKTADGTLKMPGAFHYLSCFMSSLNSGFAEWYAAAGYTRGVSGRTIDHTSVKLGEIAINALEPRNYKDGDTHPNFACNVIANFRGSYYLWGNRTAFGIGNVNDTKKGDLVAHHFLNIRQLCTTIKKQLYVACRRFTFDPNSDTLWFNFVNAVTPTLDRMKADQGIRDYKILKVYTDKKATMKAKIRIIPIEAVEDFDLEISLEDSFGETSAVVTE